VGGQGLERRREIVLPRDVRHGVVDEHRIEAAAEPRLAHVALHVLALGVEAAGDLEHLVRAVEERELEIALEVRGVVAPTAAELEQRARLRGRLLPDEAEDERGLRGVVGRVGQQVEPGCELSVQEHGSSHGGRRRPPRWGSIDGRAMMIHLSQLWNGDPAPPGHGGRAALTFDGALLALSWDLTLPEPARVPEAEPGWTDGLWEHDVLELFLTSRRGDGRYLELEIGPGGHWLGLAFTAPRRRSAELHELDPEQRHDARSGRWRGRAALPKALVEKHAGPSPWKGLVAAVLGPGRHHLCWPKLSGEAPDFHRPDRWAPLLPASLLSGPA
jgi:hypothetical protein